MRLPQGPFRSPCNSLALGPNGGIFEPAPTIYIYSMAKQEKVCAGCYTPLTFMNTPNFGSGYLKDGEWVCRGCFAQIVKVEPSFGRRSRKEHSKDSIKRILYPELFQSDPSPVSDDPADAQSKERSEDPVVIFLEALRTGKNKDAALEAAKRAHRHWWAIDVSDREHTMEELAELLALRAFVFAAVATVYVWNGAFEIADEIEDQFLYHQAIWEGERREAMELYLIHLIFKKQWDRIEVIFAQADLKKAFLDYYDLYRSVLDRHYEFQSKHGPFLNTVNKVNHYCMQIGVERLF